MSEWESFRQREKVTGIETEPYGLIIPILHNNGEYFPKAARDTQWTDFSDCNSNMPAFHNHPMALDFERKIVKFAEDVAVALQHAPPFDPDWPIIEADPLPVPDVPFRRL